MYSIKKTALSVFCCFTLAHLSSAQTGNTSMDNLLDSVQHYIYSDKIKAYHFTSELKQEANTFNNKTAMSYAYYLMGVLDEKEGDNLSALGNYRTALSYSKHALDYIPRLKTLTALSNYYINLSQTDSAILICHQGINEATAIGDKSFVAQFYNNLSLAHSYIKEYDKALSYSDKSIELKKELNDERGLANSYLNKGLLLTEMGKYPEGFSYYTLAEELYLKHDTWHALTQTHINFAWDHTDLKQFNTARTHLTKALGYAKKSDDKIRQSGVWNVFGYYYRNAGYPDSIVYALERGLELSLEAGSKRNALVAYQELSDYYQTQGDLKLALHYLNKAYSVKDSIFDETKIQQAQSLNARYETERKEKQIELLNVQKETQQLILIIILLLILLITILAYFLFLRYKNIQKRKKEEELQNQKESERIRIARDMHDEIGAGLTRILMRSEQAKLQLSSSGNGIKENMLETLERMSDESRKISYNISEIVWALNPQNDTFDNLWAYIRNYAFDYLEDSNINCQIHFPDDIPNTTVSSELRRNVFLILKESLNNIVKYSKATEVKITLLIYSNYFSFQIKDNGKGLSEGCLTNGNGIRNMEKRSMDIRGYFSINSSGNTGTLLSVENIPYVNPTKV